jgi:hypothetical protein
LLKETPPKMFSRKAKLTTISFILILALSGASFGFLLGRSHQLQADAEDATEQLQTMGQHVRTTGAVLTRGLDAVQRLLVK